jgi:hypothetical protein
MAVTTNYVRSVGSGEFVIANNASGQLPDVLGLTNGGFVVAYTDYPLFDTTLAFYDAQLNVVAQELARPGDSFSQGTPSLAQLGNGNILVAWDEWSSPEGILARLFTPGGSAIGDVITLVAGADSTDPQVMALANGGFALSYTSSGNVFAGRYDNAGVLQNGGQVNTVATAGTQNDSAIALLADGGYIVTYTDANPADQQIRGAVYNADGSVRQADFLIDAFGDNTQSKVVGLPNGNWAVVYTDSGWGDEGGSGNTGITLQIFDPSGNSVSGLIHVNTPGFPTKTEPNIAVLANGFIAVTWTRFLSPVTNDDIYARVFDQNGIPIDISGFGTEEFPLAASMGVQALSSTAGLSDGRFITAWDRGGPALQATVSELTRNSVGDGADDTITGDILRDVMSGAGGNDTLTGAGGNDTLHGGAGDDTAAFSGNLASYTIQDFGAKIVVSGPEGTDTLTAIEHLQFANATLNVVDDGNPLFDQLYYLSRNPDVLQAGVDPLFHYNVVGWHEGRDPNAFFDTSGYLAVNKDVAANGGNPLEHYHNNGWHEGRDPSANFDTTLYLINNPDVAAAGIDPLAHFLANGFVEGRQAYAAVGQNIAGGFDAQYYLLHNPDVAAAGVDPPFHFNAVGWQEGRDPNGWFDSDGYLAHYADVAAAGINPLQHYEAVGWKEGRDPSAAFDTTGYLAAYPDVAAANVNPLDHFLQFGIYEGRQAVNDGMWG